MKVIVLLGNAGFMTFFVYLILEDLGFSSEDLFLLLPLVLLLLLNTYLVYYQKIGDDFISLWLKRKSLEEKKKINELK